MHRGIKCGSNVAGIALACVLVVSGTEPAFAVTTRQAVTFEKAAQAFKRADFPQALAGFRALALAGDVNAQYLLGLVYRNGKRIKRDLGSAQHWLTQAARQNHAPAQAALGILLTTEPGDQNRLADGVKWLRKAASQGDAGAQLALAQAYESGTGVVANRTKAESWYEQAAQLGVIEAQRQLAILYRSGNDESPEKAEQKRARALRWLHRAAERGDRVAQRRLGVLYEQGDSVRKNQRRAIGWHRRAAAQGSAWAQYYLAIFYEEGRGVPQSDVQALRWFILAARHATPERGPWRSTEIIERLQKRMTKHQIRRARRLASRWFLNEERPANQASLALVRN